MASIRFPGGLYFALFLVRNYSWIHRHFPKKIDRRHICSQSSQSSQIIKYGYATPAFFSLYSLLLTTLLPTFRYFICHFPMCLKDNFGGIFRKGGVLYYTICAHTPETQKCVNFVNFVNNWQKCQCRIIVNMQLLRFFSYLIAFFSDFVHFTLKLFKILQ